MLFYNHALASGDVPAEWRKTLFTMILKTMHAKTVTFVLLFLLVFSVFFAYIFFFTHSFLPSGTLVPSKNITGRKTVFILARHQICTVHEKSPKINLTAREVDWAWWSQGAAR